MAKYKCSVCGHVYNPAIGEPEQDIPGGTQFEDLGDDWRCPVCMAEKSKFRPLE